MKSLKDKPISALEVTKFFFSLDPEKNYFVYGKMPKISGIAIPTIGNFRLNKLLHITQMLYAAKEGKYLFSEPLMAFEHGGVVYDIYRRFHFLVKQPNEKPSNLILPLKKFLTKLFNHFYKYSNEELEKFAHEDPAWYLTWDKEGGTIKQMPRSQKMLDYYQKFAFHVVEEIGL